MARSKLTPELTKTICELIEKGLPYNLVCGAVGIHKDTFYDWINKGEAGKKGFSDFSDSVNKSKAAFALRCLERVDDYADNGSVFCATWLLKTRFPKEFGDRQNVNIDAKTKNENENLNVNANLNLQAPEEIEQAILAKLSRIRGRRNSNPAPEEPEPEGESLP